MIESVSHLFSSTTCAATHVDGEGGESDLAPTDPDECPEACDVWGETSDLVRTDQNLCAENHVDRTLEAMKCAKTSGQVCTDVCSETCDDVCVWGGTSDLAWTDREMCVRTHVDWEGGNSDVVPRDPNAESCEVSPHGAGHPHPHLKPAQHATKPPPTKQPRHSASQVLLHLPPDLTDHTVGPPDAGYLHKRPKPVPLTHELRHKELLHSAPVLEGYHGHAEPPCSL